jgi:hypothetical protein
LRKKRCACARERGRCAAATEEILRDLVDWACAHRHDKIAGAAVNLEVLDDFIKRADVQRTRALRFEAINEVLRRDAGFLDF